MFKCSLLFFMPLLYYSMKMYSKYKSITVTLKIIMKFKKK